MRQPFLEALEHRRTYYSISAAMTATEQDILHVVDRILLTTPSAYNSQSTRIVLLFGLHHLSLWGIVKQALSERISAEAFVATRNKIDNCFASGCGTILFYEDNSVVERMKREITPYADKFDIYSEHTSAMHQFAVWVALEQMGFGASLQHYNPLIDSAVAEQWGIDSSWRLMAQMPFGTPISIPAAKEQHLPLTERRLLFSE